MPLSLALAPKLCSAEDAVSLIRDGDCVTVSGTIHWMLPSKVLRALEVRFLTTGAPTGLTWFDPFPTGIPGIEPLSHAGLLARVIGGWYTPHPRLRELICAGEVAAYLYPLGSLAFWCQAMAAGRDHYLTRVGLDTYLDPRQTGGKCNAAAKDDLVSLAEIDGEPYIAYARLPIHVAIIRGTLVDEDGNLSLDREMVTMSSLYQALAAKRFGGKVIVQAQRMVPRGELPARSVVIPAPLVDAIVLDPGQYSEDLLPELPAADPFLRSPVPPAHVAAAASPDAWREWLTTGIADEALAPAIRPLTPDGIVARRAACELRRGDVVNIGQGLPAREILPVAIEEQVYQELELSIETGNLGGLVNGLGLRLNSTAVLDTPAIFSLYGSGLVRAAFFSMLEFDAEGNVNLLRYGDTWVGPGGSMDIGEATDTIVFCGTFRAGGLQTVCEGGRLAICAEGATPRGVARVQAVCFNGPRMREAGKQVLYITERAVFRLTQHGPELIEVAPGVDLEKDILGQMEFQPAIAPDLHTMPGPIFVPGPMGLRERWTTNPPPPGD